MCVCERPTPLRQVGDSHRPSTVHDVVLLVLVCPVVVGWIVFHEQDLSGEELLGVVTQPVRVVQPLQFLEEDSGDPVFSCLFFCL